MKRWLTEREGLRSIKFSIHGFDAKRPMAPKKILMVLMIQTDAEEPTGGNNSEEVGIKKDEESNL